VSGSETYCNCHCYDLLCYCWLQSVLDPTSQHLSLTLDLHDTTQDVPTRVASFLQVVFSADHILPQLTAPAWVLHKA